MAEGKDLIQILEELLTTPGYEVLYAHDGKSAMPLRKAPGFHRFDHF
ncbi:MAG: hypothetical protein H8E14_10540 [Candidatus Marinimicrobia bacterium]|nr:hypothetical protein [Candidatus Neomarinimicrobiota bacterium]